MSDTPATEAVAACSLLLVLLAPIERLDRLSWFPMLGRRWRGEMSGGVVDRSALPAMLAERRARGERVVFTNGCFDLLHVGHVRYLREAASFGDLLVVGLNSDASIRLFKEPGRPIILQADRAELLAALEMVEYVVLFDEATAEALVAELKPDVYVKGGDYRPEELPEARIVEGYGGRVELVRYYQDRSTTGIIRRILETYCSPR
jgi:rfaE bifunctional protein nucleotidyltransferase chain/domain